MSDWTREKQLEIIKTELRKYIGWAYFTGIIPLWSMSRANLSGANIDRDPNITGWKWEDGKLWRR